MDYVTGFQSLHVFKGLYSFKMPADSLLIVMADIIVCFNYDDVIQLHSWCLEVYTYSDQMV